MELQQQFPKTRWAIVTGEYPPQPGGVSDHSLSIAEALKAVGDEVTVIAPAVASQADSTGGIVVHRIEGGYGLRGIRQMQRHLAAARPTRILLQYVPHAFGLKAMNVPFVYALCRAAHRIAPLSVMFHEVAFPRIVGQPWKHAVIASVNTWMARRLATTAERVYISVPAWQPVLATIAPDAPKPEWLPILSNIPTSVVPAEVAAVRSRYAPLDSRLIGHFGSFGQGNGPVVERVFATVLREDRTRQVLIVGRGGQEFQTAFLRKHPDLEGRILITGGLSPASAACHLAACDVVLQVYLDGFTSRRSSAMAALALGVPLVTNRGELTESFWTEQVAAFAPAPVPELLADRLVTLLNDKALSERTGKLGRDFYQSTFRLEDITRTLRAPSP